MRILINDDLYGFDLPEALSLLSEQRRQQALRYRHEFGQRACAAAYLLLLKALREDYGITDAPAFKYGEHGKPTLTEYPEIHFNLSHCREAAICVIDNYPIGVDIENIRPYKESLARYTMNDEELATIQSAKNKDLAFTRLWTQKEAIVKLSGSGITTNLKEVLRDCSALELSTHKGPNDRYIYSIAQPRT
ncbi:MAG: 4'-phosphopantetheinyl transferase superfamily protein [Bacteroidaceae bacterium]|nr:4'-phosphopantetheinyl transferase superfamily protein [Bacteroidaceae bacterium]